MRRKTQDFLSDGETEEFTFYTFQTRSGDELSTRPVAQDDCERTPARIEKEWLAHGLNRGLLRANSTRRPTWRIRTRSTRSTTSSRLSSPRSNPNQSLASKTTRSTSPTRSRRTTRPISSISSFANKLDSHSSTAATTNNYNDVSQSEESSADGLHTIVSVRAFGKSSRKVVFDDLESNGNG